MKTETKAGKKQAFLGGRRIGVYPGQYYDPETELHYNYFRYYNPQTGRYITPDPIGLEGGINLFLYVAGNPVNLIDPSGLSFIIFKRGAGIGRILVFSGGESGREPPVLLRDIPAGNITTIASKGPIRPGTYPLGNPIPNTGDRIDRVPSQGSYFIPIYNVLGRSELGLHAGRDCPCDKTEGCIRILEEDLIEILNIHKKDPLSIITIIE